jgi:hypothetical protein
MGGIDELHLPVFAAEALDEIRLERGRDENPNCHGAANLGSIPIALALECGNHFEQPVDVGVVVVVH